jgi:hypothetical protein
MDMAHRRRDDAIASGVITLGTRQFGELIFSCGYFIPSPSLPFTNQRYLFECRALSETYYLSNRYDDESTDVKHV